MFVEVRSNGFSGLSSAYFGEAELADFSKKLAGTYPFPPGSSLDIEGGFWSKSGGHIEQGHVCLRFYPVGVTGRFGCRVLLNSPIHQHDRPAAQSSVAVELHTTYEQLGAFGRTLEMVVAGSADEAVLETLGPA